MNKPLVSIIIPTYNRAHLIGETLDSVLAQTYPHWECIIVDDGSKDGTLEIINTYQAKNKQFKVYSNQRAKGAPGARNTGLLHASGDYCIFLDSDDILLPFCLMQRVTFMQENTHLDFAVYQSVLFKEDEDVLQRIPNLLFSNYEDIFRFILHDYPWNISACIYQSNFIKQILWNEDLTIHQDVLYQIEVVNASNKKYQKVIVEPDVKIRQHLKSLSTNTNNLFYRKLVFYWSLLNHLKNTEKLAIYKDAFYSSFLEFLTKFSYFNASKKEKVVIDKILKEFYPKSLFMLDIWYFFMYKKYNGKKIRKILDFCFKSKSRAPFFPFKEKTLGRYDVLNHFEQIKF